MVRALLDFLIRVVMMLAGFLLTSPCDNKEHYYCEAQKIFHGTYVCLMPGIILPAVKITQKNARRHQRISFSGNGFGGDPIDLIWK
jgi:hypothetical protein